ncbi:hypothetical protein C7271_16055 [filamentous cyanobacterium CCP5]|nr:hypothetical protein C7271_16055 [filamentous cyanobacterium CCP5]
MALGQPQSRRRLPGKRRVAAPVHVPFEHLSAGGEGSPRDCRGCPPGGPVTATANAPNRHQQDFDDLGRLLAAQDWRDADRLTLKILLGLTNREHQGWLDEAAIARIPCKQLHELDRLWQGASGEQFGFFVQYRRYRELGADAFIFADHVDWLLFASSRPVGFFRFYSDLDFGPNAPVDSPAGHLPARWYWALPWWRSLRAGGFGTGRGGGFWDPRLLDAMMLRLERCSAVGAPKAESPTQTST